MPPRTHPQASSIASSAAPGGTTATRQDSLLPRRALHARRGAAAAAARQRQHQAAQQQATPRPAGSMGVYARRAGCGAPRHRPGRVVQAQQPLSCLAFPSPASTLQAPTCVWTRAPQRAQLPGSDRLEHTSNWTSAPHQVPSQPGGGEAPLPHNTERCCSAEPAGASRATHSLADEGLKAAARLLLRARRLLLRGHCLCAQHQLRGGHRHAVPQPQAHELRPGDSNRNRRMHMKAAR